MIGTEYEVITPAGRFVAQWDEDPESGVKYAGSEEAISYFRAFLAEANITGNGGVRLDPDSLDPSDLYGFCQSDSWGVQVFPDPEDMLDMLDEHDA